MLVAHHTTAPKAKIMRRRNAASAAALHVLNDGAPAADGERQDALALSVQLQRLMLSLKSEFIREDGVDYEAARSSASFAAFVAAAALLREVEVEELGGEAERRCLFINLYNALTIHGLVAQAALPGSPQAVADFWNTHAYRIGSRTLTLNDIEHGILRGNARQPAARRPHWPPTDERARLALPLDARIHFALNCGARSCPPVRVYTPQNLEAGLAAAASSFLKQTVEVRDGRVHLSQLLNWYGRDFGETQGEALGAVARMLPAGHDARVALERLLASGAADAPPSLADQLWRWFVAPLLPAFMPRGGIPVTFAPYDWTINK